ncbi:MAG: ABC transporter permease subunit, partial [Phycisphaerae bacterium]|nr:ABC transporter permease subunit [Phycisphaerae bacterium]
HQPVRLDPPVFADQEYRIYRDTQWGDLIELALLDGRQYRNDQACGDATLNLDPPCAEALDPARTMLGAEQERWLLDTLWHVCLPVTCLVYTGFAILSKQTRAAMLENANADYVRTAKAKGLSRRDVTYRHVFRNSLLPLITMFVTVFPATLAGSVVIEKIFSVPGMGSLVLEAINLRDRELVLANTFVIACVNLLALLLADLLYAAADPRVTFE